jgi:hypothetical protein
MRFRELEPDWDDDNVEHIGRHGVEPEEVDSARGVARSDRARHGPSDAEEVSAVAERLTAAQRWALREEARDWDQLGDDEFARLFEKAHPVQVRLRRPLPKPLTIALDERTLNALKRLARRKQVRARHLAAIWIAERLAHERASGRSRRTA